MRSFDAQPHVTSHQRLTNNYMNLTITSIDTVLFRGTATSVTVPTAAGEVTILPKHMPIVSLVTKGTITVKSAEGVKTFSAQKGFLEVGKNETIILL